LVSKKRKNLVSGLTSNLKKKKKKKKRRKAGSGGKKKQVKNRGFYVEKTQEGGKVGGNL